MLAYAESNPEIVPAHTSLAELNNDNAARIQLEKRENAITLLLNNIQNTKTLLDYDVYQSSLSIYRNVRYQAGEDVPGMAAIYDELKQFFPGDYPIIEVATPVVTN